MLRGKKIILGVCGSISAYKAALLVRLLMKSGAEVRVVLTRSASSFVGPLTFSTLTHNPVATDFHQPDGTWLNHVEWGLWADLFLVAPASSATISRMAQGLSEDVLTALYLSARCPVWVAPAMDLDMFAHPATQANLTTLASRGVRILEPGTGDLASGLSGPGRLQEPESIHATIEAHFLSGSELFGKRILITSGPTYEPLDPVRFIGNYSTGKMGNALAEAAAYSGAEVDLISGPVASYPHHPAIRLHRVQTAREMHATACCLFAESQIAFLAAAVADYRPAEVSDTKLKREGQVNRELQLVANPDIAADLGAMKKKGQFICIFALETHNEEENARKKLERKNADAVVLNNPSESGAGFGHDTNRVTVIFRGEQKTEWPLLSKKEVANRLCNQVAEKLERSGV